MNMGAVIMATKSIYKDVRITDKALCRQLVSALENAEKKSSKDVEMSKKVSKVSIDDLATFFNGD